MALKRINPITSKRKPAKNRQNPNFQDSDAKVSPWLEDYRDLFSLKMKPVTEGFISRLSEELNQWSQLEDSIVLRDFYDTKHIPHEAFYRWAKKYPELGDMLNLARGRIGSRREKGVITRKYEPGLISSNMAMYDPEWREFIQWKSSLRTNEEKDKKVVIEINDLSKKG